MSSATRVLLVLSALAGVLLARAVHDRGGGLRLASLILRRLGTPATRGRRRPIEQGRLYARRHRRIGAHLTRLPDGRRAVLAVPLDGSRHTSLYPVAESRPWKDFERRAGLVGAAWGPLRSANAGL